MELCRYWATHGDIVMDGHIAATSKGERGIDRDRQAMW